MKLWLDQMLPRWLCVPIAEWTGDEVRHVGEEYPEDEAIFYAARTSGATVLTKDSGFVSLVPRLGVPPRLIWLRVGNCSNVELVRILEATLPTAIRLLETGESIVEVTGAFRPST